MGPNWPTHRAKFDDNGQILSLSIRRQYRIGDIEERWTRANGWIGTTGA